MLRHFATADVFTDRLFGGNPVAVILNAEGLSTEAMQAVASEFNLSETTFILPHATLLTQRECAFSPLALRCRSLVTRMSGRRSCWRSR